MCVWLPASADKISAPGCLLFPPYVMSWWRPDPAPRQYDCRLHPRAHLWMGVCEQPAAKYASHQNTRKIAAAVALQLPLRVSCFPEEADLRNHLLCLDSVVQRLAQPFTLAVGRSKGDV